MLKDIFSKLFSNNQYEPEYEEEVQHDTVMEMTDGKLVEVTSDDFEEGK